MSTSDHDNTNLTLIWQEKEQQLQSVVRDLQYRLDVLQTDVKIKTTQLNMLEQLRKANQHLVIAAVDAQNSNDKANAEKLRQEELLSMLAHELRNPLAPIVLATDLIGQITDSHPELPKLHAIIARQVDQLSHLVNDLLDAARISTGKITLQRSLHKLADIIDAAVETSQPLISRRHQQLGVNMPAETIVIFGDAVRLTQVFANLLINASKFTPEFGKIAITVTSLDHTVAISVKDNGVGIALFLQPHIFDLFTQGFQSLNRSQGGLGIGLSVAKLIIELHEGTIDVYSQGAGFGTDFIVRLPISPNVMLMKPVTKADPASYRHLRVLVVEDNVDTNEMLANLLRREGHVVTSIYDGKDGYADASKNEYDVIICDIGLPGMNGYDLVKNLRRQTDRALPVFVGLSGYSHARSSAQGADKMFHYYLVKPIKFQAVRDVISSVLNAGKND